MTTTTLVIKPPNAVTGNPGSPGANFQPLITGSGPVLGDDDDATYVTLQTVGTFPPFSSLTTRRLARTLFDAVPDLPAAGDVTEIRLRTRLTTDDPVFLIVRLGTTGFDLFVAYDLAPVATGTLTEDTRVITAAEFSDSACTVTEFLDGLAGGGTPLNLEVEPLVGANNTQVVFHEFHVEIDYPGVEPPTTEPPVTRLFPRKDGRGPMGSAPRLIGNIPPERIVGGHM